MGGGKIYGFSEGDCGRIKRAVNRFERYYRTQGPTPARARYPVTSSASDGLIDFVAGSSGISAGSYSDPQSGTVTILARGTGPAMTTTGGSSETAYNQWATAVGASKFGKGEYRNGYFYVVVWDC